MFADSWYFGVRPDMTVSVVRQVSPFVTTLGQRLGPVLAFKAHIRSNWGIFEVENPYICGDTSSFLTLLLSTLLLSLKFSLKVFSELSRLCWCFSPDRAKLPHRYALPCYFISFDFYVWGVWVV